MDIFHLDLSRHRQNKRHKQSRRTNRNAQVFFFLSRCHFIVFVLKTFSEDHRWAQATVLLTRVSSKNDVFSFFFKLKFFVVFSSQFENIRRNMLATGIGRGRLPNTHHAPSFSSRSVS